MRRSYAIVALLTILLPFVFMAGCEKEKIVESTEYVHDIEYVELPADTIYRIDTVVIDDPNTTPGSDTVFISDTVVQIDSVYDTVIQTEYIHDTVITVEHQYDTVTVTDTVVTFQCDPNSAFAINGLHFQCDPLVIQFIYQEFGYDDGWVFYLSSFQVGLSQISSDVYDIHGYIDYWTPDWSGYYPLEYYFRVTFTGGDPSDPTRWQLSEPPASSSYQPGFRVVNDARSDRALR